ncbi:hypothetical protein HOLleu_26293 [Holothuria leucospilota]|uniref:Uncharacterized protein n=1 Tax=Holothuria leucospilota TaxID=206669 RepID=A0A9Q1BTT5_HOLLE|nr:hypothetical protein HOLleu_26293 [Holothuria leucospilota]
MALGYLFRCGIIKSVPNIFSIFREDIQQTTSDVFAVSETGLDGLRPPSSSSTRPTDMALLDHVIKLSNTDEGTDIDKAYYLYHKYYKGTMPLSDHNMCRPSSFCGNGPVQETTADAIAVPQAGPQGIRSWVLSRCSL